MVKYVCFAFLAMVTSVASGVSGVRTVGRNRPNVLFIFIDDQGYYDLGCYGAKVVETPRIDALAANGVRFTDYYAAAPICSPSRTGLITGCYPRRTGNEIWVHRPDASEGIPPSQLTIAELFKSAGYATACIGKWHLGFKEPYLPWNQGFDHYFGILHNLDSYETAHFEKEGGVPLLCDGKVVERNPSPSGLARRYTDEAIAWIEERAARKEPFFLYLPHTMLHNPLGVSPEFQGKSKWHSKQEYGDAIQELDYHVGRLMDTLKRLNIEDNTFVVYTSDNGRWPGRTNEQPIQGSKLTTWEGGLRVPCIAYGPGLGIRKGHVTRVVTHAMDWYPTLASIAGIKIPEGVILDGRDLSALLTGKTDGIPAFDKSVSLNAEVPLRRPFDLDEEWSGRFTREEYLNAFFYHGSQGALAAVRSGRWKMFLNPSLTLYDLEEDPGEHTPLTGFRVKKSGKTAKNKETKTKAEIWEIKTKLRGMVIQFQREMNRYMAVHYSRNR